jgi:hypothetical protein
VDDKPGKIMLRDTAGAVLSVLISRTAGDGPRGRGWGVRRGGGRYCSPWEVPHCSTGYLTRRLGRDARDCGDAPLDSGSQNSCAGQEQYDAINDASFTDIDIFIICFALSKARETTLENVQAKVRMLPLALLDVLTLSE